MRTAFFIIRSSVHLTKNGPRTLALSGHEARIHAGCHVLKICSSASSVESYTCNSLHKVQVHESLPFWKPLPAVRRRYSIGKSATACSTVKTCNDTLQRPESSILALLGNPSILSATSVISVRKFCTLPLDNIQVDQSQQISSGLLTSSRWSTNPLINHCAQTLFWNLSPLQPFSIVPSRQYHTGELMSSFLERRVSHVPCPQVNGTVQTFPPSIPGTVHSITARNLSSRSHQQKADAPVIKTKVRGIQKDISPLTTKRVVRRKKAKDAQPKDQEIFEVMAFATAEEYSLESLKEDLERQGLYGMAPLPEGECPTFTVIPYPKDVEDVLHVEANYRVDNEPREIIFFREGSVVFWNMPHVEREAVLRFLKRHQIGSYDPHLVHAEFEQVEFIYSEEPTGLVGDEICLKRPSESEAKPMQNQLEKYTFSNALALSVKLAIWEASLEKYVDSIEWVLQDLKEGQKIRISRTDILRKTGELFNLRHLINLSSDLLDTPDFYWDREELEQLYVRMCTHLNIRRRTNVINVKLTHCCELAQLLREHLNDKHHTRLEVMIIVLITIEVVFEIVKLIVEYVFLARAHTTNEKS